jgi:membrane protein implicated in regulation of membrane protease activity
LRKGSGPTQPSRATRKQVRCAGVRIERVPPLKSSGWIVLAASLGIAVVLVLAAVLVGTVGSPESEGLSFELRRYLIQFFLVTALGAVVAIVVYEYKKRREESDRQRKYTTDSVASVLGQLDAIYRRVKRTRRLLRLSRSRGLEKQAYIDAMLKLDEDQQDLEQLFREIMVLERRLPDLGRGRDADLRRARLRRARDAVRTMEGYLGDLWSEHEDVAAMSDKEFKGADLQRLNAFVLRVKTGGSDFHRFNGEYHRSRETLIELVADSRIGPQLNDGRTRTRSSRGATGS